MRALVRNEGETIVDTMNIKNIDWSNGKPLTDPEWIGGPYKLIENFTPPVDQPEISEDPSNI